MGYRIITPFVGTCPKQTIRYSGGRMGYIDIYIYIRIYVYIYIYTYMCKYIYM